MGIDKEGTIKFYDAVAPLYNFLRKRSHEGDNELMPFVLEALDPQDGEEILDAGTGPGIYAIKIAQRAQAARVVGVDLSPKFLDLAKVNIETEGIENVEFQLGDLECLPFPDGRFDKLVCAGVISAVPDRPRAARELFRVLRDGGTAVVTEPNQGKHFYDRAFLGLLYLIGLLSPNRRGLRRTDFERYYFDEESLRGTFAEAGFTCVDVHHRRGSLCAVCKKEDAS